MTAPVMTKEQYLQTQIAIFQIAKMINSLELHAFLAQISQAEAQGPMLDPTMWRKAQENLSHVKRLAEALLPVKDVFMDTFNAVIKTATEKQNV